MKSLLWQVKPIPNIRTRLELFLESLKKWSTVSYSKANVNNFSDRPWKAPLADILDGPIASVLPTRLSSLELVRLNNFRNRKLILNRTLCPMLNKDN